MGTVTQLHPTPPHNVRQMQAMAEAFAAERALVGAVITVPGIYDLAKDQLDPADCVDQENAAVLRAVRDLHASGRPFDIFTVAEYLEAQGGDGIEPGSKFSMLMDWAVSCPSPDRADAYLEMMNLARQQLASLGNVVDPPTTEGEA